MPKKLTDPRKIEWARVLRHRMTPAERVLWTRLRKLGGTKFRRQQAIGDYVVDFIEFEARLIVELDGSQHDENRTRKKDERRTKWLESEGYRVLRFWNNDVMMNLDGTWLVIQEELKKKR